MKCIKNAKSGEIKRVSNEQATKKVASGEWFFCSKKEWKDAKNAAAN